MGRIVCLYIVLSGLFLFTAPLAAQNITIADFLTLRTQYNEGKPLTANGIKKPSGWELEKKFGTRENQLCELWRIGSTKASIRARLVADVRATIVTVVHHDKAPLYRCHLVV